MDLLKILDAKPEPSLIPTYDINFDYRYSRTHQIGTSMSDFQMELLDQIVSLHYSDILKYFHDNVRTPIIIDSLKTMIMNSLKVCNHPYLLIDHYFPKSLTMRDLPNRLVQTSGKFSILNDLLIQLNKIAINPLSVVILTPPGKYIDLVDALCSIYHTTKHSGMKVRDINKRQKNKNFQIHIYETNKLPDNLNFDWIINMDITKKFDDLKGNIINLVGFYSIEHILWFYSQNLSSIEEAIEKNLEQITAATAILRSRTGQIPSTLKPIYSKNLHFLQEYLKNPYDWPIPNLLPIKSYSAREVEKSLQTETKFSFDNEAIIKEEMASTETVHSKNSMISHIIQPRYKKTQKKQEYYQKKRQEKRYLSNPLIDDIAITSGQNEVLTHARVYALGKLISEYGRLFEEVKSFGQFQQPRLKNFDVMLEAKNEMTKQVESKEKNLRDLELEIEKFKVDIESCTLKVKNYKKLTDELQTKPAKLLQEKYSLLATLISKRQSLELQKQEYKYTSTEIEKAHISIDDSNQNIEKRQLLINQLQNTIREQLDSISTNNLITEQKTRLTLAESALSNEEKRHIELESKLADALGGINEFKDRRYVNYARNGLGSRKI
ncbi:Hda3 protein [Martiniozyma asiatica (nom. inval.)]|nr:Hda3 protein [Martiniozyma asiatica]